MMQLLTADYYGQCIDEISAMHRLRCRVFKERLDRDVQISGDMEIDEFDALHPASLIQRAIDGRVQGCVRLLPSTGPTMLLDTFPTLLGGALAPTSPTIWESSRFARDLHRDMPKTTHGVATATYELFAGMIEFGLSRQLTEIVHRCSNGAHLAWGKDGPWGGSANLAPWVARLRSRDISKPQLRAWRASAAPEGFRVQCRGHPSRWLRLRRRNPEPREASFCHECQLRIEECAAQKPSSENRPAAPALCSSGSGPRKLSTGSRSVVASAVNSQPLYSPARRGNWRDRV